MFLKSLFTKIIITVVFGVFCQMANAQMATELHSFQLPEKKVVNSIYNSIAVIDARNDTTNLGIIQTGALNKKKLLIPKEPLSVQFQSILTALTDNTAKPGQLLIQLRRLAFSEATTVWSEKGFFTFRAELYARQNDAFKKLSTIDTLLTVSAMDVTNKTLKTGSEIIADYIAANLYKQPIDGIDSYSAHDVAKIDSIEKSTLKLYTTNTYVDGVYLNYYMFREQTPDAKIMVDGDEIKKNNVTFIDSDGILRHVKLASAYALVFKGRPYIATEYGFLPLKKVNNDFVFISKLNTAKNGDVLMASALFGVVGGAIAASQKSDFEMKIDHNSGQIITGKEINKEAKKDPVYN